MQNGVVFNNTINYCFKGVYVDWYSRNITISGNRFISDNVIAPYARAIHVSFLGHNTTIYDNYFFDYYECIAVFQSDNCTVENNLLENTYMDAGVYFVNSDYGKILNNTLEIVGMIGGGSGHEVSDNIIENGANWGIRISGCPNTTITGNKITNCDTGIYIMSSGNNTIKNNSVASNTAYGINLGSNTEDSLIYLNQIFDNGIQAYDQGSNNKWNNGSIGNYYGDYSGKDIDDDGIGDTQYNITGPAFSMDIFPIWWDAPVISINSPIEDQIFGTDSPEFEVAIEGIANTIWYSLNSSTTYHIATGTTGKINQLAWDALEEGNVSIIFYVNDSRGLIDSQEVNIIKQIPVEEEGIIPGYDIILVLGILSVISILSLALKKYKKLTY